MDRAAVYAIMMGHVGLVVPNEYVHAYVSPHPAKLVGVASVDPHDPACCEQLRHAVESLGFRALKLSGAYQNFNPADLRYLRDAVAMARSAGLPEIPARFVEAMLERDSLALPGMG